MVDEFMALLDGLGIRFQVVVAIRKAQATLAYFSNVMDELWRSGVALKSKIIGIP